MKLTCLLTAALAYSLLSTGCNTESVVTDPKPLADLELDASDSAGRVADTRFDLVAPSGSTSRAVIGAAQPFRTSGPPGTWSVTVLPPATHTVGAAQANPVVLTVREGETRSIVFRLERRQP